ncbi:MAG: YesU family protein [Marinifilum sp.]|nr:YesU family protein [Marinifilum sp.]
MKQFLLITALFTLTLSSCNSQNLKTKLVYSCDFNEESDLDDWVMEGPGIAKIADGKLLIHSKYYDDVAAYYQTKGNKFTGNGGDFYETVETAMRKDIGDKVSDYEVKGVFRGGHLVYWNTFKTPDNYIIECDFKSLSESALHMLMFSCYGNKGEDVFAPNLKKRNGLAPQYTRGDIANYRISFFAPGRGTSNMRKCPGRVLTVKGEDFTLQNKKGKHHLKIVKNKHITEWYINNQLSFRFEDEKDNYLKGGQTAIRLMVPAKGLYDNYKIYKILD